MAMRSTALKLVGRTCLRALDYSEAGAPYDRGVFQAGIAAHAVCQVAGEAARAAADVYLVGQGRTHRTLIDHIRLDADRAEVRDHCAQWLARHHLVAVGATAPTWAWAIVRGRDVWMLDERVISDRAPGEHPFDALVLACLAAGGRS